MPVGEAEEKRIERWQNKFRRGFLRLIILRKFLDIDPQGESVVINGVTIRDYIERITQGNWKPSPGSIYPIIAEMEQDGLIEEVESSNDRNRDYIITDFGHRVHESIMEMYPIGRVRGKNFHGEQFRKAMEENLSKMSVVELKAQYERHLELQEIIKQLLQEKVINDPSLQ